MPRCFVVVFVDGGDVDYVDNDDDDVQDDVTTK
jgi:hypothetical protein